jgi:hypothetical protein
MKKLISPVTGFRQKCYLYECTSTFQAGGGVLSPYSCTTTQNCPWGTTSYTSYYWTDTYSWCR